MGCSCRPIFTALSSQSELWLLDCRLALSLLFSVSTEEVNCPVEGCYGMISQFLWNLRILPSRYVSFGDLAKQLTPYFVIQAEL